MVPRLLLFNDSAMLEALPSSEMELTVDCYLNTCVERKLVVQLVWPGRPHNVLLIHALAALRLHGGPGVPGLRALFFPSKATSCCSLTRYHIETQSLLSCVQQAAQVGAPSATTIVLLRLQELVRDVEKGEKKGIPLHPNLNDIVLHFRPIPGSKELWPNLCDRLFRGLRREMKLQQCPTTFPKVGEPVTARDAVFHIPHASNLAEIKKLISSSALTENPPCVMLVDATRQSAATCSYNLRSFVPKVIRTVFDTFKEKSPGIYFLTDDPIMANAVRYDFSKQAQKWKKSEVCRADLDVQGVTANWRHGDNGFAQSFPIPTTEGLQSPKVRVEGLFAGKVHHRIYKLCNILREHSLDEALRQMQGTNRFLRRITTLPCSVGELRRWLLEAGLSDEAMESYGRNFDWKSHALTLQRMISETSAAVISPDVQSLMEEIGKLYSGFENGTPMAIALLEEIRHLLPNTLGRVILVFPRWFQAMLAERFLQSQGIGVDQDAERIAIIYGRIPEVMFDDESVEALIVVCNPEDHLEILLSRDFRGRTGTVLIFDIEGAKKASRLIDVILQDKQLADYHSRAKAIKRTLDKLPQHLLAAPLMPDLGNAFKPSESRPGGHEKDPVPRTADQIILYFNDRSPVLCGRDSRFRVYDPESWNVPKFIIKSAKDLTEGDQVFLMPDDLRSEIEGLLRTGGAQSVQHVLLESYHQEIMRLTAGFSRKRAAAAREIFEVMCHLDPEMRKRENLTNVLRWINLESLQDIPIEERRPQAPRQRRHFLAFAKAIGIEEQMAETYWNLSICRIRSDRIHEGRAAGEFFTNLLFDGTFAAISSQMSKSQVDDLRMRALDNLHQIQSVRL